jgi:predicted regulator of Ras-like GTPase activity (Roadblock/LC7/MglB family)
MNMHGFIEEEDAKDEDLGKFLEKTLHKFLVQNPNVNAAAIITMEGLPIMSAFPRHMDEIRIAAITATLLSLAERSIIEIGKGKFSQLFIKGSEGYLVVLQAGPNAVLMISTTSDIQLGLLFFDAERLIEKISDRL